MGLARSTYYDAPMQTDDDMALVEAMPAVCDAFEAYGWRRVQAALRQMGWRVNHKEVRRIIRARTTYNQAFGAARSPPPTAITTAQSSRT